MANAISSYEGMNLLVRPPHGLGTGDPTAWKSQAVAAAAAGFDILGADIVAPIVFLPTVDCYFRAGKTGTIGNADSDDFPMLAGWIYKFLHVGAADRFGSVIRKTSDGLLYYYNPTAIG